MKYIRYLLVFILGILLTVGISNAYKLNAIDVTYDKKNSTLESENVQGALDELGVLATTRLQYGDAMADDILEGKTALVQGKEVIGTFKSDDSVLLWSGSGSSADNITCYFDYSPYDYIKIVFAGGIQSALIKCPTSSDQYDNQNYKMVIAQWSNYYNNSVARRIIKFTSTGITCNTLDASSNGGAYIIPIAVYGIKGK